MDRNFVNIGHRQPGILSLSARRAWIEITQQTYHRYENQSLSARRAWIEIIDDLLPSTTRRLSLSARRAWIEILYQLYDTYAKVVALRKESVDRNTNLMLNA